MKKQSIYIYFIVYLFFSFDSFSQQAFTSVANSTSSNMGNMTYVVGQYVANQSLHINYGVLQVYEITTKDKVLLGVKRDDIFINVYPNPTSQKIKIEYDKNNDGLNLSYQIIDLKGKMIKSGFIDNKVFEIDLSQLSNTTYQMLLKKEETFIKTFKIIKK